MTPFALALLFGGPMLVAALLLTVRDRLRQRVMIRARLGQFGEARSDAAAEPGPLRRIGDRLARSRLFNAAELGRLRQNLYAAGLSGPGMIDLFIGVKVVLLGLLTGLVLLWLRLSDAPPAPLVGLLVLLGAAVVALRAPDAIVARIASSRRERIDRGLADALDLLVVCAEAGVGIEPGLERVAREMRGVHPDLAAELQITVSEMRLLSDRLQGLHNMGERIRLESVRAIASTLSQTLRYGTPLGRALRTLAADFRLVRQTAMEERAARLPVLITIPMIAFILPATTLVVAGPAFLQLIAALSKM